MLPQFIIDIFQNCEGWDLSTVKSDEGGQMVVAFTITKIKLSNGKPIFRFVAVPFLLILVVLNSLVALFALLLA